MSTNFRSFITGPEVQGTRPVLVTFESFKDREDVLKNSKVLNLNIKETSKETTWLAQVYSSFYFLEEFIPFWRSACPFGGVHTLIDYGGVNVLLVEAMPFWRRQCSFDGVNVL